MSSKSRRILVVEDHSDFAELLQIELEKRRFNVELALDCKTAEKIIRDNRPDLLITDINLPDGSGKELIERLVSEGIFLPVIAMSGEVSLPHESYPFFQKPFSFSSVADFIAEHFEVISDLQLIRRVSEKSGVPMENLGKVVLFDPTRGWGLLRVVGLPKPLYVNAADIGISGKRERRFEQLHPGQVVRFQLNPDSPRGARAEKVEIIYDEVPPVAAPKKDDV